MVNAGKPRGLEGLWQHRGVWVVCQELGGGAVHLSLYDVDVDMQGVLAVLLLFERQVGMRSSGTNLLFWLGLLGYGIIKMRSLILLAQDQVRPLHTVCIEGMGKNISA